MKEGKLRLAGSAWTRKIMNPCDEVVQSALTSIQTGILWARNSITAMYNTNSETTIGIMNMLKQGGAFQGELP